MYTLRSLSARHLLNLARTLPCLLLTCSLSGCFQITPPVVPQTQAVAPPDTTAPDTLRPDAPSATPKNQNDDGRAGRARSDIRNVSVPNSENVAWPNWMGPDHNGISQQTGWSTQWPSGGLPIAWSKQIGIGFSSVAIAEGRLFTMGHTAPNNSARRYVSSCMSSCADDVIKTDTHATPATNKL